MAPLAAPEPMNATSNHSKVRVSITLAQSTVVAGEFVSGKMEMECKTDKLGIGTMMVELFAFEELTSRDHSARMTFLHSQRLFQGPSLPPSNAVQAHPLPGDPPLPEDYYKARRGHSTFFFRIPLPVTCPASINFASGLAKVRYEVRGGVGVYWKGEKQLVTDKEEINVLEAYEEDFARAEPEGVIVGENGRFWVHGKVVGGMLVAGESACVELQVKNHSNRKNTGLVLSLNRTLILPNARPDSTPLQLSDTIITVPFRGPEYILPAGGEGVANLVFDVPPHARSVRGGTLEGDESETRASEALFEIRATVEVKITMGLGNKDIVLSIPVTIVHPDVLPELPPEAVLPMHTQPALYSQYTSAVPGAVGMFPPPPAPGAYLDPTPTAYQPHPHALLPLQAPLVDQQNQVWIPHPTAGPVSPTPIPYQYYPPTTQAYYSAHPHPYEQQQRLEVAYNNRALPRPSSAGPISHQHEPLISGLPVPPPQQPRLLPLFSSPGSGQEAGAGVVPAVHANEGSPARSEREEGKGERASRIAAHLRMSSAVRGRGRSVSPVAHRFPLPDLSMPESVTGPEATVLHSPRPQLKHKQSFTVDPVTNNSVPRSERVVELEKMAAEVDERAKDLSADLPRVKEEGVTILQNASPVSPKTPKNPKRGEAQGNNAQSPRLSLSPQDLNKTLPVAPPVTKPRHLNSDNKLSPPSAYSTPLDSLFANPPASSTRQRIDNNRRKENRKEKQGLEKAIHSTTDRELEMDLDNNMLLSSVPPEQTPPTPTLVAFKRPPRTEGGLDALERRLLAEVGTRKVERERRPDVRDILGSGAGLGHGRSAKEQGGTNTGEGQRKRKEGRAAPIDIPATSTGANTGGSASSERLDESAISSLTLPDCGDPQRDWEDVRNGRERERDRDQDSVDGKTHKAGKSRGPGSVGGGMGDEEREKGHVVARGKEGDTKKQRERSRGNEKMRKKAQGRIAAWLGEIDPDMPPQEEIIPPSPSVVAPPSSFQELGNVLGKANWQDEEADDLLASPIPALKDGTSKSSRISQEQNVPRQDKESADASSASPNPRSSGFVPIGTLKRDAVTTLRRGNIARESTAAEEARKITALWSETPPFSSNAASPATGANAEKDRKPQPLTSLHPLMVPHVPRAQTIRTDRRISPPSASLDVSDRGRAQLSSVSAPGKDFAIGKSQRSTTVGQTTGSGSQAHSGLASTSLLPSPPDTKGKITPIANANLGSDAGKNKKYIQRSPQLPMFPRPTREDPETKYDVRSARGGRGGKVTAVASLWASAAAAVAKPEYPPVRKKDVGIAPVTAGIAAATAAVTPTTVAQKQKLTPLPTLPKATSPPLTSTLAATKTAKLISPSPLSAPKKALTNSSPATSTSASASGPKTPTPEPKFVDLVAGKKAGVIPVTKSPSVPAMISSSLAIPTLSSTASLAKPVGASTGNTKTDSSDGMKSPLSPVAAKNDVRTTGEVRTRMEAKGSNNTRRVGPTGSSTTAVIPSSAADSSESAGRRPPSREMAFGHARLRDLIKKYQGNA